MHACRDLSCLLSPCLAVLSRWHANRAVEYDLEIIGIIIAAVQCNLCNGKIGIDQHVLGFANTAMDHLLYGGIAEDFFEGMG